MVIKGLSTYRQSVGLPLLPVGHISLGILNIVFALSFEIAVLHNFVAALFLNSDSE